MNITEAPSPSSAMFVFLVPASYECTLLYATASYFVRNEGSAVSSCVWPSVPSKCGNTKMMFDVKNVARDNREKESEISSTPTTSFRVLVLTASCKNEGAGLDVVTIALVCSLFVS
jgi:hypothetical protein